MRFEKKKMRFDGVTRHMGSNIRRYVYDGVRSICVSKEYEPDTQADRLVVSVAMPKGKTPDTEWVSGLLKNFGMRNDIAVDPFIDKLPYRTTFFYSQNQPRDGENIQNYDGSPINLDYAVRHEK